MQKEGKSKEQIKEELAKLRKKLEAGEDAPKKVKVKELKLSEKEMDLVEKLKEAGLSKDQVMRVVEAMRKGESI